MEKGLRDEIKNKIKELRVKHDFYLVLYKCIVSIVFNVLKNV